MTRIKRLVPKRRFKKFENGDEWAQYDFKQLYEVSSGYAFNYQDYCDHGISLINGASIEHGKINKSNMNYLPEDFLRQYSNFVVKENDIVLGLNRPIINGNLKISKIPIELNNSLLYQRAGKINYMTEMDNDFSFVLLSQEILKYTLREAVGSDQPFISTSKLSNWKIIIPKGKKEQEKIGSFFKNIDEMIQLQQSKVNKVKDIKSAYLSEMFPKEGEKYPKKRFEGFTKPWKLTKFKEIADVERGLTYHPSDIVEKGGVRVLRSSNIDEDTFITKDDDVFVNENAINIEFSQKQNILITSANGSPHLVGKHAILEQLETPSVHGGFMLLARTASPYFLNASMSSDWYRKFIRYHVAGGGGSIGNIKKSDLEHQLIYIPSKEEQEKIGQFFKNLDNKISIEEEKLAKLEKLKQAYLNDMFV